MNAAGRLVAFASGLAITFAGGYAAATLSGPEATVPSGQNAASPSDGDHSAMGSHAPDGAAAPGLSLAERGYTLNPIQAPRTVGDLGALTFSILDPAGNPVVDYVPVHEKQLHLILVRSDGSNFAHVHPVLDRGTGTWSIPWRWSAAGSYRAFADFVPAGPGSTQLTLTRTIDVAGPFTPEHPSTTRMSDQVGGYTVRLDGTLIAGSQSRLTASISRDGQAVTTLQPYLGAFGHLVALRDGDMAYLHVHPEGAQPQQGDIGGPAVSFAATAPTAGRYLLYLDFRIDGAVHTATFVVDAARDSSGVPAVPPTPGEGHSGGH
ncbi:heavy-metal-associated domain-containing protein [Mycobacterium sp. BMJ-28]